MEDSVGHDRLQATSYVNVFIVVFLHNTVSISEMKVRVAITKLLKRKSTGIDKMPAEFLQNMGKKGIEMMTWIINK